MKICILNMLLKIHINLGIFDDVTSLTSVLILETVHCLARDWYGREINLTVKMSFSQLQENEHFLPNP